MNHNGNITHREKSNLYPLSCHAELVSASQEIPKQVRDDTPEVQGNITNYNNNKGVALVITLLVLTLLLTIILEFNLNMRVEARAAASFRDDMKAYYLARSGITFAIALLAEDEKTSPDHDSLDELWAQKIPPLPAGDGFVSVEITDESGKINVNKLAAEDEMHELMARFLEQFDLKGEEIANAIADWIDDDINDERSPGGAESSYYEGLEESYEAKNNRIYSLQELRLIKGIENDTYEKLRNFLTPYTEGDINVNTASKEVLMSITDAITGEIADAIISSRLEDPFHEGDVREKILSFGINSTGYDTEISNFITVQSNYFSVTSTGEVNQVRKTINAVVKRESDEAEIIYWRVE